MNSKRLSLKSDLCPKSKITILHFFKLRTHGITFTSIFNGHVSVQKKQIDEEGDYDKPWDCKLSNANLEKIKYKFENRSGHLNNIELNINTATIQNIEEEYDYVDNEPTK